MNDKNAEYAAMGNEELEKLRKFFKKEEEEWNLNTDWAKFREEIRNMKPLGAGDEDNQEEN